MATAALYVSTSVNFIYMQLLYHLFDHATMIAGQTLFSPNDGSLEDDLVRLTNRASSQVGAMTGTLSVNVGRFRERRFIPR